jgi:dTDP-4-dehydrorhamnose reductase
MKTVIFGNGLLGGELAKQTQWDCISRKLSKIDICKPSSYEKYLHRYNEVINCIGYTDTSSTEREPSWSVNYVGVIDLVEMCNKYSVKLIQISTDYIYANSMRGKSEEDVPVHYSNWYTYSKLLADAYVQAKCNNYLLIRTSFKPSPFPWEGAWKDLRGNFDYVHVIAFLTRRLVEKKAQGIYNVGTKAKTMQQLAIQTRPECKGILHESMPFDVTMDLTKQNCLLFDK